MTSTISAHSNKSYHLGFGNSISRSNLSKANESWDPKTFKDFAYHMIDIARRKRIVKDFEIMSFFIGYDYKTKGYLPESFYMKENFNIKADFKVNLK